MLQGEVAVGERKTKRGGIKYRGMISTAAGIAKEEVSIGAWVGLFSMMWDCIHSVWLTWVTMVMVILSNFNTQHKGNQSLSHINQHE